MSNTRTLTLPDGGSITVPLPGANAQFVMRPASMLASADAASMAPLILIGVVIGVGIGVAATAYYLRRKR
jgi:hypothetical protein